MKNLKDALMDDMKSYFGKDEKRIAHALKVTEFAEEILKEEDCNRDIVIAAAILHDIGIPESERKYGSNAGHYQEMEGPPIARGILSRHELKESFIDEVCEIIGNHHSPGKINTNNFKIVYDADCLVNMGNAFKRKTKDELVNIVEKVFLTETGKKIALRL